MKKILILVLCLLFLISASLPVNASTMNQGLNSKNATGLVMPVSQFNDLYGKPKSEKILKANNGEMAANIAFNSIQIDNGKLSFSADVGYNGNIKELKAEGTLSYGLKHKKGINSIVGSLVDCNGNFNVLLFEIYNSKDTDKVITDTKKEQTPHLKIYLTDNAGNIILFEIDIPEALQNVGSLTNTTTSSINDELWFVKVIKPYEQKMIPSSEDVVDMETINNSLSQAQPLSKSSLITPMAVGDFSNWVYGQTYYTSYYSGGSYFQFWSLPYGTWKSSDVYTADTTWTSSFKIAEHCAIDGVTNRDFDNLFTYQNVKLTTGVGAKTTIIRAYIDGRMIDTTAWFNGVRETGSSTIMKVAEKLWSTALPSAPSLSDILGWVNAIEGTGSNVTATLGSSNIKLNNSLSTSEGMTTDPKYELYKITDLNGSNTGHYITFQTVAQYNSTTGTNASTSGVMKVSWNTYLNFDLFDSGTNTVTFNYTARRN